jgi:ABC-type nickel/cobalt efflux system permease component RcnA
MSKIHEMLEHVPHPHIELRKEFLKHHHVSARGFNSWLAVSITNLVGTMWCAYAFAILAFISLPEAIRGGTSALIAWIAQTFLQLVLLSIIMVGQKVAAEKSDRQLEQTYKDAEALLQMNDEMHRLIKQNVVLTAQIEQVLRQNTTLTEQINQLLRERRQA